VTGRCYPTLPPAARHLAFWPPGAGANSAPMGNAALEVLDDITEGGNRWRDDRIKLPPRDAIVGDLAESREPSVPSILVAPMAAPPPARRRSSLNREEVYAAASAAACSAACGRPAQVVLQPGYDDGFSRPGVRPASTAHWTPLNACKALARRGVILTQDRLLQLHAYLPVATRFANCWKLIYNPSVHGTSIRTFYRQCQAWPGETLLLMEDTRGFVFGGFASHTWRVASHKLHFGSPECFVFTFGSPDEQKSVSIHPWSGGNQYFMYGDMDGFAMGGGNGFAFWVDRDLLTGSSAPSQTFGTTEPIASDADFVVQRFECWTFDHSLLSTSNIDALVGEQSGQGADVSYAPCGSLSDTQESSAREQRQRLREQAMDALRFEAFT